MSQCIKTYVLYCDMDQVDTITLHLMTRVFLVSYEMNYPTLNRENYSKYQAIKLSPLNDAHAYLLNQTGTINWIERYKTVRYW